MGKRTGTGSAYRNRIGIARRMPIFLTGYPAVTSVERERHDILAK